MECISYIRIRNERTGEIQPVPCGKCYPCKMRRLASWSWRLQYEYKQSHFAQFITLTYSDELLPANGHLHKPDLQKFFKRYRKALHKEIKEPLPLKYFACGEYGDTTDRPHYHAILFNPEINIIEKTWTHGSVHYGPVNEATIKYTLKYMVKDNKRNDKPSEFQIMSKGLGTGYLYTDNTYTYEGGKYTVRRHNKANLDWHNIDYENRYSLPLHDIKVPMPRLWKQLIFPDYKRAKINKAFKRKKAEETPLTTREEMDKYYQSQQKLSTKKRNKI